MFSCASCHELLCRLSLYCINIQSVPEFSVLCLCTSFSFSNNSATSLHLNLVVTCTLLLSTLFTILCLSVSLSLFVCLSFPLCLSVCLSVSLSLCLSFCDSVFLSLSVCLSFCPSVCLSLSSFYPSLSTSDIHTYTLFCDRTTHLLLSLTFSLKTSNTISSSYFLLPQVCSDVDKQLIFDEIIPSAHLLMTDVFGNYVLQKLFEVRDIPQLYMHFEILFHNKYSTW